MFELENIFNNFDVESEFREGVELGVGHINDTYLIRTKSEPDYVLQRINHLIFPDVPALVRNKVLISDHLLRALSGIPKRELHRRVLSFVRTKSGENYHRDHDGNYWNLTVNIHGCMTYERVTSGKVAFEAGRLFGEFLYLTRDFDASRLSEIIPDFHKMSYRFEQFDAALEAASGERKDLGDEQISFANENRIEIQRLETLIADGKIPIRATHNDTKISNALFSQDDEALCVIDTDTVMPGIVHFDFGDAVRTICNTGDEDERDLDKVNFNLEYFEAFVKGFVGEMRGDLSDVDVENLAFSAKVMTFIVGLRMLTDFLEGDIYFRTKYETHNLDRVKSQFKLANEIEKNMAAMDRIVMAEVEAR